MTGEEHSELLALRSILGTALAKVDRLLTPTAANDDQPDLDPDTWFQAYVARHVAAGHRPSREQDHDEMIAAGFTHARDVTRELRGIYAPSSWHVSGPRRAVK